MVVRKVSRYLAELIERDGLAWGIWNIASRIRVAMRSRFAIWALNAPGLHLGGASTIRGVRCIRFGQGIHVGGAIWIEAVTRYAGKDYAPCIVIGDGVSFSEDVHITCIDRIEIGRNVLMGSRVYISDHGHGVYKGSESSRPEEPPAQRLLGGGGPVRIDHNVWIGDNVVIVGPVHIGHGAVVGANSVVRHDIPAMSIVAGVPARAIKKYDETLSQWIPA